MRVRAIQKGVLAPCVLAVSLVMAGCRAPAPSQSTSGPTANQPSTTNQPTAGAEAGVSIADLRGSIAFASSSDEGTNIWVLRFDGSATPALIHVTDGGPLDAFQRPSWSPAATQIAYQHTDADAVAVYVMDADGTDRRLIAVSSAAPAWSPAGDELAISHLGSGQRGIALVDLTDADLELRPVTTVGETVPEEYPAWSPDGGRLAFNSHRTGGSEVWAVARDGSGLLQLTDDPNLDNSPDWSPDGALIAFSSDRSGEGDIYTVRPDGTNLTRLTSGRTFEGGPSWSPDGRYIVFSARTVSLAKEGNLSL
jgi:Tol biopolymer transport system component